ncbi:hypothetical protein [Micromonospora sp. WMMD964]|uniref:hypothetical protein n=1 Tax=Micromonospora sp. WMMD964 TaxID=3016091 RepID=UPI00249AFDC0|nr:hypothetical protein [Micromonospora sp. WMMD964]WFE98580.1 hypothetical protein O7616_16850 [Micromonospora sp. WMMD964]
MSEYNAKIAARLNAAIRDFETELLTLDEIQAALQSAISLFENDRSRVSELVRLAEVDLEEIQFTVLAAEQRPAAIFRLARLRASLVELSSG